MLTRTLAAIAGVAVALSAAACSEKPTTGAPAPSASTSPPSVASILAAAASAAAEQDGETKTRRVPDPMVYLDGEEVAGFHFLEMPQKLRVRWLYNAPGYPPARRYSVADYIESLGISLTSIKQIHIQGGRTRWSIIDGDELIRKRDTFTFSFTRGTSGKPLMHYPEEGMKVNTQVDIASLIVIYQRRTPPKYDRQEMTITFDDGVPIEGIPYARDERTGGTRVYVDGALVGAIKRKTLPSSVAVAGTEELGLTRFRMRDYLEHIGVPPADIHGVEFISNDELSVSMDGKAFAERSQGMVFTLPKRSRGRIQVMDLPEASSKLDAILIYVKSELPDRVAQLATPGSEPPQGNPKKGSISAKGTLAQPVQ